MTSQVSTFMQNDSDIQHMQKRATNPTMWQSLFNSENIEKCAVDSLIAKKEDAKTPTRPKKHYNDAIWSIWVERTFSFRG